MRYQFEPRANRPAIDLARAAKAARDGGATRIAEAFPMMLRESRKSYWRGTNQPRTVAFTAPDDTAAALIAEAYDTESAFVWNITERHWA